MERDQNQFSPELLQMMRDEERGKFLKALKDGASWAQLYSIRNNIRKINKMIEEAGKEQEAPPVAARRSEEEGPRG